MSNSAPLEIQFQLRAKQLSAEPEARQNVGRLPRITRVVALAIHFDNMLRKGEAKDYADIGRMTCLCRERVSQIMRLNYLAPDIQVELLYLPPSSASRYPISEVAVRKLANLLAWDDQRREWTALKQRHGLSA
jgi:hypothetical protein